MKVILYTFFFTPYLLLAQFDKSVKSGTDKLVRYEQWLSNYNFGIKNYDEIYMMIDSAKEHNDTVLAQRLSADFVDNYLLNPSKIPFLSKANIVFIRNNTTRLESKAFAFFYGQSKIVDSIMNQIGYSRSEICYIISKEVVDPEYMLAIKENKTPKWHRLKSNLEKRYNSDYVCLILVDAKVRWYEYKKDWKQFCRSLIRRVKSFGPYGPFPDKDWQFNSCAWDLFEHSYKRDQLNIALEWSDSALKITLKPNAEYLDTYANILYKIGKKKLAIAYEEKALKLDSTAADIHLNLERMKANKPTWEE